MLTAQAALLVAAGGALGSLARYAIALWLHRPELAWGTVAVNAGGSFLAGLLMAALFLDGRADDGWRLALVVGFLGGFTTMSAFAVESALFLQAGAWRTAMLHLLANPILSVACAALGLACGRRL